MYNYRFNSDTFGGYGQATQRLFSQRLGVTAGLRLDDAQRAVVNNGADFNGPGFTSGRDSKRVLPKVAVDYRLSDKVLVYGLVAAGWKPDGVNPNATTAANSIFYAEHAWNYEGGLKSYIFSDRLTLNLSGFYNHISNYQDSVVTSSLQFLIGNAKLASVSGFEVEASFHPVRSLEIQGGYGLARGRYNQYVVNPASGFNYNGKRIEQIPDSNLNIIVQDSLPKNFFFRGELIAASNLAAYQYTAPSAYGTESFLERTVAGYVVGNLRAGFESRRFELTGFVSNIANKRYLLRADVTSPFGTNQFFGPLGSPRTYGLRAAFRFR